MSFKAKIETSPNATWKTFVGSGTYKNLAVTIENGNTGYHANSLSFDVKKKDGTLNVKCDKKLLNGTPQELAQVGLTAKNLSCKSRMRSGRAALNECHRDSRWEPTD